MRLVILVTITAFSILLNGCVLDKLFHKNTPKQVVNNHYYEVATTDYENTQEVVKKPKKVAKKEVKVKKVAAAKPKEIKSIKKYSKKSKITTKKRVKVAKKKITKTKTTKKSKRYYSKKNQKSKKTKYTKKSTKAKKYKYTKKSKKYRKKRIKILAYEPYSVEKNEGDPELLGPQTTFNKNPLKKLKKRL